MRFCILTAVTTDITVFWDVTYSMVEIKRLSEELAAAIFRVERNGLKFL
jgi:hypothetical protein